MTDTERLYPLRAAKAAADDLVPVLEKACLRLEVAGGVRRLAPAMARVDLVAIPKVELVPVPREDDVFTRIGPREEAGLQREHNFLFQQLDGFFKAVPPKKADYLRDFQWPLDSEDQIPVRVTTCDPDNWGLILLRATGSERFVKHVHASLRVKSFVAKDGRVWHGLGKDLQPMSDPLSVPDEQYLFKLLHMKFVPAVDRSW